ncbi:MULTISPECIES: hypothetical protein [Pseudoalteromonas]|uniref:hypothetical protein n=1 Tax=Pseudoalteromonas TaxID=53246 RepID=UPI000F78F392|nr:MULTISPECIES: hypothetical protein [Pseudoalteromonas]MCG7562464.1 hypothetical protein [Pseudoalteromonas sp. McH1-42]MEC4087170.1 hypothetical protein [Pseudoalteromonas rubra]
MKIDLQSKTRVENGVIESYWFENKNIGLSKTLFHRVILPLAAFDSGLDCDVQPTKTEIVLDWYELDLTDPSNLDGVNLSHSAYTEAEGSVYIGCVHNWCDVKELNIYKNQDGSFKVSGSISVEFNNEGVAENEDFSFQTCCKYIET